MKKTTEIQIIDEYKAQYLRANGKEVTDMWYAGGLFYLSFDGASPQHFRRAQILEMIGNLDERVDFVKNKKIKVTWTATYTSILEVPNTSDESKIRAYVAWSKMKTDVPGADQDKNSFKIDSIEDLTRA